MPQDAITLAKTARELNDLFEGAKVNKITQPSADEIVLSLYSKSGAYKLCICANAVGTRVGITNVEKRNPSTPTGFCMLLRKHILSATIKNIITIRNERIVKIIFEGKNDFFEIVEKELYCEIMGKYSNVIFCENEIICGTLKTSSLELNKERALLVGAKYSLPKSQGKYDLDDKNSIINLLSNFNSGNLCEYLFNNIQGLSIVTAKEICYRFFNKEYIESPIVKTNEFYDFILDFINNYAGQSIVVSTSNKLLDFCFCDYQSISGEKKYFQNILLAEQYFFDNKYLKKEFTEMQNRLITSVNSKIKKEEKKLQIIAEKEIECNDAENVRRKGELITANIYKIKRGDLFVIVEDYYNDNKPLKINLDDKISPNDNAQKLFKKYAKLKNTLKAIIPQKEQAESEINYLKSVLAELKIAHDIADLQNIEDELMQVGLIKSNKNIKQNKKIDKIDFRTFEYNGYTILAGKNNLQNDKLTFSANPSDLWLHTKDYHSAHVIIKGATSHVPNEILQLAAEICAYYSEAKSGDKIPVDYTQKKYVKKPPKSKYGAVIYTDYKTVYVTPQAHKNLEK